MKPNFALDFRKDHITLLHQQEGVWVQIGKVAVDDPDLTAALGYMRSTALGLSPQGFGCKLVLPDDAILYTTLSNLPTDADLRAQAIGAALVGRTPYDVADLTYDWRDDADEAHLAVIARETLAEAEEFATTHRFNPLAFAAWPEKGRFDGEAWFGQTAIADHLLAADQVVERDDLAQEPAQVSAGDFEMGEGMQAFAPDLPPPMSTPMTTPEAAFDGIAELAPKNAPVDEQQDAAQSAPEATMDDANLPDANLPDANLPDANLPHATMDDAAMEGATTDVPTEVPPETEIATGVLLGPEPALSEPALEPHNSGGDQETDAPLTANPPADQVGEPIIPAARPAQIDLFDTPASFEAAMADEIAAEAPAVDLVEVADAEQAPVAQAPVSQNRDAPFAPPKSNDLDLDDAAPMALDVDDDSDLASPEINPELPPFAAPAKGGSANKAEELLAAFAARRAAALGKEGAATDTETRIEPVLTAPKPTPPLAADPVATTTPRLATPVVATPVVATPVVFGPNTTGPMAAPIRDTKANTAKKPGAKAGLGSTRINRPAPDKGARRSAILGFVLTIVLLLLLAAAAAMSSYLGLAWNSYQSGQAAVASANTPSIQDEMLADLPSDDVMVPETASAPPVSAELTAPASLPAAQSSLAAAPTLVDPAPKTPDSAAETALASPQELPQPIVVAPPDVVTAPAAHAAQITPTAQGVMTPEGVFLIAGRPALVPAARPAAVIAAAALRAPATGNPALAGKKPLPRPETIAANAAPANSGGAEPPNADPALAGKRPLSRPENVLAQGRTAAPTTALASLMPQQGIVDPTQARSPWAVSISKIPAARPKGLKDAADAAALAAAQPQPDVQIAVQPEVQPDPGAPLEADNEPEVATTGSSNDRSIVSKNATVKNALNLSQVNLVGVFGSQNNRYALVRQASGRFKKIYVGDRFDGGTVAAITDSELRYSKGGEMVALKMPRG